MSAELDIIIKKKFRHLSNAELVRKINNLPDFGWDDEGYELSRRQVESGGRFTYEMQGNTIVILTDKPINDMNDPETRRAANYLDKFREPEGGW